MSTPNDPPQTTSVQNPSPPPEAMGPADWFALVLRSFGIWQLTLAISYAVSALTAASQVSGYYTKVMSPETAGFAATLATGVVLLKAAPAIARRILLPGQLGSQQPTVAAMVARDWFTVALRLFGINEVILAVEWGAFVIVGAQDAYGSRTELKPAITALMSHVALAAWLLKTAPGIARFFYPSRTST